MASESEKKDAPQLPSPAPGPVPPARDREPSMIEAEPDEDEGWDAPKRPPAVPSKAQASVPPPPPPVSKNPRPGRTLVGAGPVLSPPPPPAPSQPPPPMSGTGPVRSGTTKTMALGTQAPVIAKGSIPPPRPSPAGPVTSPPPLQALQQTPQPPPAAPAPPGAATAERPLPTLPPPLGLEPTLPGVPPVPPLPKRPLVRPVVPAGKVTTPGPGSPTPGGGVPSARESAPTQGASGGDPLVLARAELGRRAERLSSADAVGSARGLVELSIFEQRIAGDEAGARRALEQARARQPQMPAALERLRRLVPPGSDEAISLLDAEIAAASTDAHRADLLASRGRASAGRGRGAEAREAFAQALKRNPEHAAALRGLEAALIDASLGGDKAIVAALEGHLARLTVAYGDSEGNQGDDRLSAWVHVERAALLDERLGESGQALASLRRAVSLSPGPGPERHALYAFLVRHRDDAGLCEALVDEAAHEPDHDRASRLTYAASLVLGERLGQWQSSIPLLERSLERAPGDGPTARRALARLGALLERAGDRAGAIEAWRKHLALLADPASQASEHARLSRMLEALGRDDEAVGHARASLSIEPLDRPTREALDASLERLGRHDERALLWLEVASSTAPAEARVRALLRAAHVADRKLGRPREAVEHLRTAWALSPGDGRVFDALSALLAAPPREAADDVRGVRTRAELYAEAARAAKDAERRVPMLEKLLALWEDELSQPKRAMEIADQLLALEPGHRGAILALGRNAARAGDRAQLARALSLEASVAGDPSLKRSLLLRAADETRESLNDAEAALALVDRAAEIDPKHPDVLRARASHLGRMGRHDGARAALMALAEKAQGAEAFALFCEIAQLDEHGRRAPSDAVESYRKAARALPGHALPAREVARLLRQLGEHRRLVDSLREMAGPLAGVDRARLLFEAAEVLELSLGDDRGALEALSQAAAALGPQGRDQAIVEAEERILLRAGDADGLASLYRRWLTESPLPHAGQRVKLALAQVAMRKAQTEPAGAARSPADAAAAGRWRAEAAEVLERALADEPASVPAMRLLRLVRRAQGDGARLAPLLAHEADVVQSGLSRRGALWELAALEAHVGEAQAMAAVERVAREDPADTSALDEAIRLGTRLLSSGASPEPGGPSSRSRLLWVLRAREQLAPTPVDRALYECDQAAVHERDPERELGSTLAALAAYRSALSMNGQSLLAARGLERLSGEVGDRESRVIAHLALAQLVERPDEQASHLVRAADLIAVDPSSSGKQLELYEQALLVDPDCVAAARALSSLLARDPARLAARLGEALERAREVSQITLLGLETGRAVLSLSSAGDDGPEPAAGLRAVSRVLAVKPDEPTALMLLARLQASARLWPEARDTLLRLTHGAPTSEARVAALFELAALYRGPLGEPDKAQGALEAVLAIEPRSRRALEMIHQVALVRGDRPLAAQTLRRLADDAPDPGTRVEFLLRLSDALRELGDGEGRLRALGEAVLARPDDDRAWSTMARLFRPETADGAVGYAQALHTLINLARERGAPVDPKWLTTLGLLEATTLMRPADAVEHLSAAVRLPGASAEARAALGRGLEAIGRNDEAVRTLREVLSGDPDALATLIDPSAALSSLESALAKDGRAEERLAVQEVRACIGEMPPEWLSALRNRALGPAPFAMSMGPDEIVRMLVPEARQPAIDVFVAIAPIAAKVLRFEASSLGLSSRDRLSPRDGNPTRALADRMARAFGVEGFELYLSPSWPGVLRAFPGDPPLLVGPDAFAELPELEQASALGRIFARLALGVPWLDDLPVEAIDGLFLASLRAAAPGFAAGEVSSSRENAALSLLPSVQKAIGRRQRKQLEAIIDRMTPAFDPGSFAAGVRKSEHRLAYLSCGSLVSTIDYLRRIDRDLSRVSEGPRLLFVHPVTGDVLRYGLGAEAYAERRRLGTVWT